MYFRQLLWNLKQLMVVSEMEVRSRSLSYCQGQYYNKTREYFYFIDHQGMLFLDDAKIKNFTSCFKDKRFLEFFFRRMKKNETSRHQEEFPYISVCGRELNFIKFDDRPVVYTHLLPRKDGTHKFCYGRIDDAFVDFQPDHIFVDQSNGRVYHPAPEALGDVGLVCSKLAIEFSKDFEFQEDSNDLPTHFNFKGVKYELNQEWYKKYEYKNKVDIENN